MAAASWAWSSFGVRPRGLPPAGRALREAAEDVLLAKAAFTERQCEMPGVPRSTFLMAFSPDGRFVASTHGNHAVYVSSLSTGRHVRTLSGHPRTPWCVAFHPQHARLLASGCLGGQVRVWDLGGGSEVWTVATESVVASVAFHPRDRLLAVAAFDEIHFWDWSRPRPLFSCRTDSVQAKLRFVAFDALGHKLITAVSCWSCPLSSEEASASASAPPPTQPNHPPHNPSPHNPSPAAPVSHQIVSSYRHLVQRYNNLVRNYHVIMGRAQPPHTIDRGTDPMDVDPAAENRSDAAGSSRRDAASLAPAIGRIMFPSDRGSIQPRDSDAPSARTSYTRDPHSSQLVVRNELSASLNRLHGFMENSIDQTLNMWERFDSGQAPTRPPRQSPSSDHLINREHSYVDPGRSGEGGDPARQRPSDSDRYQPQRERVPAERNSNDRLLNLITDIRNAERYLNDTLTTGASRAASQEGHAGSSNAPRVPNEVPTLRTPHLSGGVSQNLFPNADVSMPSTSASFPSERTVPSLSTGADLNPGETRNSDAFSRVTRGVQVIERHTQALINMSTHSQPSLSRVRAMWEELCRKIINLQRSLDQEPRNSLSISPLERCLLFYSRQIPSTLQSSSRANPTVSTARPNLSSRVHLPTSSYFRDLNGPAMRSHSSSATPSRHTSRLEGAVNSPSYNTGRPNVFRGCSSRLDTLLSRAVSRMNTSQTSTERDGERNSPVDPSVARTDNESVASSSSANASTESIADNTFVSNSNDPSRPRASVPPRRNRFSRQSMSRLRSLRLQEIGHRRNVMNIRRGELEITRDRIRTRARRVLSIMFGIMMDCLEADQLSSRIISMLRSLKRALSVTSMLLVAHLYTDAPATTPQARDGSSNTAATENSTSSRSSSQSRNRMDSSRNQHQPGSNEMYIQINRSRTLLRLHPISRSRRREPMHFVRIRGLLSHFHSVANSMGIDLAPSDPQLERDNDSSTNAPNLQTDSTAAQSNRRSSESYNSLRSYFYHRRFLLNRRLMAMLRSSGMSTLQNRRERTEAEQRQSNNEQNVENPDVAMYHVSRDAAAVPPLPLVQVNDVPINEMPPNNPPNNNAQYVRGADIFPMNILAMDDNEHRWSTAFRFITECPSSPVHRIQVWDLTKGQLPDLSNVNKNIVVRKCKIHNDASIDISKDGRLLVALLPAQRMGIFSLEWHNLGECLYTTVLEQNAVSVSLSPCTRHLAVGLGSRRVSLLPLGRNGVMAMIYRLGTCKKKDKDSRFGTLIPVKSLEQNWDSGFTSLNCLRWAPEPGQGLVYADNTGQLKILS